MDGGLLSWTNVLGKVSSAALIVPTSEALGQLKWNWFHNSRAMWDFEIFDKASRGPLGALMLLFRTRGRSLAALGALLIVLLLAIDTFFQQVVSLPVRWELQDMAAAAPKTIMYKPSQSDEYHGGELYSPVLFGNGTRPEIPISCPTSNCTFPHYDTLAVCSQCADVSDHLTFGCFNHAADWIAGLEGYFDAKQPIENLTACGYYLNATSESRVLMSGYLIDSNTSAPGEALLVRNFPLTSTYTKAPLYRNGSINFKSIRHTIVDTLVVSARDGTAESVYLNETPIAQECILSCVFNTTPGPFPWVTTPYVDATGSGFYLTYVDNISIITEDASRPDQLLEYSLDNNTAHAVIQSFVDIFPSYTTVSNQSSPPSMRYKTWKTGPAWTQLPDFNPWLAPNNVTRHMERLATALTNVVRSAPSRLEVMGSAFDRETYIEVHWEWLIFPFALLVLSLVFLVATIIKTSKHTTEAGLWKNSAMPTLIYGLPKEAQTRLKPSSTSDTKKVRIQLLPNMGWRVSGHAYRSPTLVAPNAPRALPGWI
ncbi:hypothetical protein ACN47E_000068 [Coniothyrium glycines]